MQGRGDSGDIRSSNEADRCIASDTCSAVASHRVVIA
jgi:hypothetical protein